MSFSLIALGRRARVTVQSMQTTTSHLEQRGLVQRSALTSQGRRADLHVTAPGQRALVAAGEALDATIRSCSQACERRSALPSSPHC